MTMRKTDRLLLQSTKEALLWLMRNYEHKLVLLLPASWLWSSLGPTWRNVKESQQCLMWRQYKGYIACVVLLFKYD